jgi:hypothetical protein
MTARSVFVNRAISAWFSDGGRGTDNPKIDPDREFDIIDVGDPGRDAIEDDGDRIGRVK